MEENDYKVFLPEIPTFHSDGSKLKDPMEFIEKRAGTLQVKKK